MNIVECKSNDFKRRKFGKVMIERVDIVASGII